VSSSQGFSFTPRRSPARVLRVVLRILVIATVLALLWGLVVGAVWLYGANRLQGTPIAALRDDVMLLGASGARAPEDATTLLVLLVEPLDATVRRPSPLVAPPLIVQLGGGRERPAVLVLPPQVEIVVDGRGTLRIDDIQRELGQDRLAQAVMDYTEVRLDHVVLVSTDLLPGLVRLLGPLEVCGARGCSEPTPDDVRAWQRDPDVGEVLRRSTDVLRAVATAIDRQLVVASPLLTRRVIDLVAGQVVTDVDLGLGLILALAEPFAEPRRLDLDTVPLVRNPTTGDLVVLEEAAMIRFQRLRDGLPFDAIEPDADVARLRTVTGIAVLNGAGITGLAALVEADLRAAGFVVIATGNDVRFDRERSVINYRRGDREAEPVAFLLAEQLPGALVEAVDRPLEVEGRPVPIVVILGRDRVDAPGGRDGSR
jgi:hypothetical protein